MSIFQCHGNKIPYAPLAQLVEQLTLNQWVRGSSPRRCTKYFDYVSYILEVVFKSYRKATSTLPPVASPVGVFNAQGPPVPIPNTEVKLCWADNTCTEACREDRSMPTLTRKGDNKRINEKLVFLLHRVHLYPFRTQKLSCAKPKILARRRAGKIGQCQHFSFISFVSNKFRITKTN